MMHSLSAERYLFRVRRVLPCDGKMKRRLMPKIRQELSGYLEGNPGASYQDLAERFGRPEQIAASYVENTDAGELLANMRVGDRIVKIVAALALAIIIIWAVGVTIAVIDSMKGSGGYAVEYITVINETEYIGMEERNDLQ